MFKKEPIPEELLNEWSTCLPQPDENLAYAAQNEFIPRMVPTSQRVPSSEDGIIGKPRLIQECGEALESEVWFKQDDSFDHPYVFAKVKICTNDLNFPRTVDS